MAELPVAGAIEARPVSNRRKRLAWRCRYRGMRELDILLARLADQLPTIPDDDIAPLEALLEAPEPVLLRWLVTPELPDDARDASMVRKLRAIVTAPTRAPGATSAPAAGGTTGTSSSDRYPAVHRLAERSVLRVHGDDAAPFLQGQLSCDVSEVDIERWRPGAWCSPRGRVLVLFHVYRLPCGDFVLSYPTELSKVATRLSMFTLRANARVVSDSDWQVYGWQADTDNSVAPASIPRPDADAGSARTLGDAIVCGRLGGRSRRVEILTRDAQTLAALDRLAGGDAVTWQRADITDGLPDVHLATSDRFVPQMLNLELHGAVSFNKGCYVGQEVVARTQHLGRIKRRLYQLSTSATGLAPGDALHAPAEDGAAAATAGEVVASAERPDGGSDVLAVLRIETAANRPTLRTAAADPVNVLGPAPPLEEPQA